MRALAVLLLLVASCCKPCPKCAALPPVASSPPVVAVPVRSAPCELPTLPVPVQVVGFASPDGILVTKTDLQGLIMYLAGIRAWVDAAQLCLGGRP